MWNIIAVSHLVFPTPLSPTRTTFTTSCLDSITSHQDFPSEDTAEQLRPESAGRSVGATNQYQDQLRTAVTATPAKIGYN